MGVVLFYGYNYAVSCVLLYTHVYLYITEDMITENAHVGYLYMNIEAGKVFGIIMLVIIFVLLDL